MVYVYSRLDELLGSVAADLGYRRAVLMFADVETHTITTLSALGVPPLAKLSELSGSTGEGFWPLSDDHAALIGIDLGLPFHTCLHEEYMQREFSSDATGMKRSYYARLAAELDSARRSRYEKLFSLGLFSNDYATFLVDQDKNYDLFASENWSFAQMYPSFAHWSTLSDSELSLYAPFLKHSETLSSRDAYDALFFSAVCFSDVFPTYDDYVGVDSYLQLHLRFGMSDAQFFHTLMLGVSLADRLIGVAQFDSPVGVSDFTVPLPLAEQLAAQEKLSTYAPPLLLESLVAHLYRGEVALADRLAHLLARDNSVVVPISADSLNVISLPSFSSLDFDGSGSVCLKRYSSFGVAALEHAVRTAVADAGSVRTLPSFGATPSHLVAPVVASVSLYDLAISFSFLACWPSVRDELLCAALADVSALQGLSLDLRSEQPTYAVKLSEVFAFLFGEDYSSVSSSLTSGFDASVRKQDASPRNVCFALEDLCSSFGVAFSADGSSILQAADRVAAYPDLFLSSCRDSMFRADFETMHRLTFLCDDVVELVDAPVFDLSFAARTAYLPDCFAERFYRSGRWLLYLSSWLDFSSTDVLWRERDFHLATMQSCLEVLDVPSLFSSLFSSFSFTGR